MAFEDYGITDPYGEYISLDLELSEKEFNALRAKIYSREYYMAAEVDFSGVPRFFTKSGDDSWTGSRGRYGPDIKYLSGYNGALVNGEDIPNDFWRRMAKNQPKISIYFVDREKASELVGNWSEVKKYCIIEDKTPLTDEGEKVSTIAFSKIIEQLEEIQIISQVSLKRLTETVNHLTFILLVLFAILVGLIAMYFLGNL